MLTTYIHYTKNIENVVQADPSSELSQVLCHLGPLKACILFR